MVTFLKRDLHKVWTVVDKLSKAKLIDKKLEGVYILKELGLNKGAASLKCLTNNNGDIAKTLTDFMPKDNSKVISYITTLSADKEYIFVIDGFFLVLCIV